ncbi:MAG: hypothetical protein MIN69_20235, partial [Methylorubrum extorquens]|uniref:hypothetical protein n=1 Tax=Methylorubrum extorquens TaxID=408 RepID=UPI002FEDF189
MKDFNLSDWALGHRSLVWFLMLVCLVAGVMAYSRLGREEDPPFAIKELCGRLGDDGVLKAAYRGGCRSLPEP